MFKSKELAYWNPSNFRRMSCIFGIGYGFLLILLFNSIKLAIDLIDVSDFGITN